MWIVNLVFLVAISTFTVLFIGAVAINGWRVLVQRPKLHYRFKRRR